MKWYEEVESDLDQVKRIDTSKSLKKKILSINIEEKTAIIQGSSPKPYNVTLDGCECTDFSMRNLPCKHMYCLAAELGLLNLPVFDKKKSSFNPESDIEKYKDLYLNGQISSDTYVKICTALSKLK